jgi:drug/metabolite transporter (DMT)-like permease
VPSVLSFSRIDALLIFMAVIWGTNYSIVKSAFDEIEPQAFNALRMAIASAVFLLIIGAVRRAPMPSPGGIATIFRTPVATNTRDWVGLAGLGFVGHFLYQYLFIGGLARTSVANSSLILAATPILVALLGAGVGEARVGRRHWIGAAISVFGIYLVVGRGPALGDGRALGDLMMVAAVCCWAVYTVGARHLMLRHSPVGVTGMSMALGTLLYVPATWHSVRLTQWTNVGALTWIAIVYSALFALCIAYTIWYVAVREIGSARTAVYSNIVPLVAMGTAVAFLGEPLGWRKVAGAAAVLGGVALTRTGRSTNCEPRTAPRGEAPDQ